MKTTVWLIALAALLTTGCSTIIRGTTEEFSITSDPSGADIRLSNGMTCVTPCLLEVKRRPGFTVTARKDGYEPAEAVVTSSVSGGGGGAMAGNIIFGGLIGGAVDATNGSLNKLEPNPLHLILRPDIDSSDY